MTWSQPFKNDRVGAFAIEPYFSIFSEYHRHSLAHIVEVENAQELIDFLDAIESNRDASRSSFGKDKAKIPC